MKAQARLAGLGRTVDGELTVTLIVDAEAEALRPLTDKELALTLEEYRAKRSLNANAYLWQLCDKIAKAVGTDKDAVYLLMLRRYGVFDTLEIIVDGIPLLRDYYRVIDVVYTYDIVLNHFTSETGEMAVIHAYKGSHEYNTKEMADLINGIVSEATELGIETITEKELNRIKAGWQNENKKY